MAQITSPDVMIPLTITISPEDGDTTTILEPLIQRLMPLLPGWVYPALGASVNIVTLTGGVNNTASLLCKASQHCNGVRIADLQVLIRIYGNSTSVLVDRERELECHRILHQRGLAPRLFARFNNGYVYEFTSGTVCTLDALRVPHLYTLVARHMAEWHAVVPVEKSSQGEPTPNLWSVLEKWIHALPAVSEEDKARKQSFLKEREYLQAKFTGRKLVFSHCDLIHSNIIMLHGTAQSMLPNSAPETAYDVRFIDFEYAMAAPAAFDIACHLSEWVGYELDYRLLPSINQRREFMAQYVMAYNQLRDPNNSEGLDLQSLVAEVDSHRGLPGLFWGIAALIQAAESNDKMDFDAYGNKRIEEYWEWRAEEDGSRASSGANMPLRECKWLGYPYQAKP